MSLEQEKCFFCKNPLEKEDYKIHRTCIDELIALYNQDGLLTLTKPPEVFFKPTKWDEMLAYPFITDYFDKMISSYDEVCNCDEKPSSHDFTCHDHGYNIDRDASATIHDSLVLHNKNIDRDLTLALIQQSIEYLRNKNVSSNDIIIITGYDTLEHIKELCNSNYFFPMEIENNNILSLAFLFGIYSIKAVMDIKSDTISRIYFVRKQDPYLIYPELCVKIRDLQ